MYNFTQKYVPTQIVQDRDAATAFLHRVVDIRIISIQDEVFIGKFI